MSEISDFEKFYLERFTKLVAERGDQPTQINANDIFEWLSTVYHFTIHENKEAGESAFNVMDYYYMEEIGAWLKKQIEKDEQFKFMSNQIDKLNTEMPCGHLARYAVNGEEGTQYCSLCDRIALFKTTETITEVLHCTVDCIQLLREVDSRVPGLVFDYYDENSVSLGERIEKALHELDKLNPNKDQS